MSVRMCLVAGQLGIDRTGTSFGILSRPSNFKRQHWDSLVLTPDAKPNNLI